MDVAEANVAKLHRSQPAEVTVEAFPDRNTGRRCGRSSRRPTARKRRCTVKVTILDHDPNLKPEMSAKVDIPRADARHRRRAAAPAKPRILVPSQAVVTRDGGPKVFEVVDGMARARTVSTGATRSDQVVVTGGLGGTETLIVNPPPT